jgi:signal transduction histidine kinase
MFEQEVYALEKNNSSRNTDPVPGGNLVEVRQLAAGIAHELWNPLAVIKTMMFAMRADISPEDPRCLDFDVINEEVDHMEHSIQRFLDYTWPTDPVFAPILLGQVVSNAMSLLMHKAQSLGVQIETQMNHDVMILADQKQIEQVFVNLALNALHAMPEGGKLSIVTHIEQIFVNLALDAHPITTKANKINAMSQNGKTDAQPEGQDKVGVAVTDTGQGMPPDLVARIFEPFVIDGGGLGLAIVQQIVERHGGKVAAVNRPEGGTTITVTLPIVAG